MKSTKIWLTFHNTCEEALQFYKSCFTGEISNIVKTKRAHDIEHSGNKKHLILHAEFAALGLRFIASDKIACDHGAIAFNNAMINICFDDQEEFYNTYQKLSEDGQLHKLINSTASTIAVITDRFNISWALKHSAGLGNA